jgi:DNA polymerase III delta prime subunit
MIESLDKLRSLPDALESRIIGQREAFTDITALLSRALCGCRYPGRPLASMLFLGPTGVGKTETVRIFTEHLFGEENKLETKRFSWSKMPKAPPREHPKPFRSLVRRHIEAILSMRRHKRMSWAEIARRLKAEHGVAVHRSTFFRVYKRARDGREPFGLGAAAERAARQSQKAAVPASAAEPSLQQTKKHS